MPSPPEPVTAQATSSPGPAGSGGRLWVAFRPSVWDFLELLTLSGFVIAQPLFDVLGRSPEFFVFRQASAATILLLTVVVTLLPALVLSALETISGLLGKHLRQAVHLAMVSALLVLLALEVLKKVTPLRGKRLAVLAVVAAAVAAWLYVRRQAIRLWLRYLAPAPLVFALLFTTVSPVSQLVLPQRTGSAAMAQIDAKTPVVMVLFDEFPMMSLLNSKGQIDARLYPNFAKLAAGSTWYRNATGISGITTDAVPAVLTGRYPTKSNVPLYSAYPNNLFTLLGRSYDLKVFESVTRLCPASLCRGSGGASPNRTSPSVLLRDVSSVWAKIVSPRNVQEDVTAQFAEATLGSTRGGADGQPPRTRVQFGVVMNNKPVRYADFLSAMQPPAASGRPSLYFIHMMLPHPPWYLLPGGRTYEFPFDTFGLRVGRTWDANSWTTERWPVLLAHQRHLLQLAYVDSLIGQLEDRLKAQRLWDRAAVVVTADHGNSFTPGQPRRILTGRNAAELMWVPLFVKSPGQRRGVVDDRNWEQVDLLPTIADMLHVRVPWPVDGMPGAGGAVRQRREKYFYTRPAARRVVDGPSNQALALRGVTDRVGRPQEGPAGLFRVGLHADLVGRPLSQMRITGASGLVARLDHPASFANVKLASGKVPAQVSGEIHPQGRRQLPLTVVVALNGVVGAVGQTFQQGSDPLKFAAMVPDSLFKQGHNRPQLFLLEQTGGTTQLRPLSLSGGA